ncbi:PRD domain-containing protein, partial [Staphylococcus aureus]|uniref:PRD domain-containing protein n=1 Tax=Staphylococcus aureus TaxID=1280 RepID=UPI001023B558
AIHRIKYDMLQPNPLRQDVMRRYPQIIEAVSKPISPIEQDADIRFKEDELTYITIHFASSLESVATHTQSTIKVDLLCVSGIGTAHLLKS